MINIIFFSSLEASLINNNSDACCALRFYPHKEECSRVSCLISPHLTKDNFQEIEEQELEERIEEERRIREDFGNSTIGRLRKRIWNITEYPETSLAAKVGRLI